jgi:hypothetical protein
MDKIPVIDYAMAFPAATTSFERGLPFRQQRSGRLPAASSRIANPDPRISWWSESLVAFPHDQYRVKPGLPFSY